ncbi:MAG: SdpI family protein [Chitinophagaceae bacterium]|nr:SdpI family protein [Chitinophagaceae bacterium]
MKKWISLFVLPIILAPAAYLWKKWAEIPETVPVHYGLDGQADRFGPRSELLTIVLILTGVNLLAFFFLPRIYKIDPRKTASDNKSRLKGITVATVLLLSVVGFVIVENAGAQQLNFQAKWLIAAVGAFWCVLGNYMYNLKPNYFAGIRLPWTLNNEENWRLTHRLAGKIWFASGLLIILLAFIMPDNRVPVAFLIIVFISILIPVIYSYRHFAKNKNNTGIDASGV